MAPVTGGNGSPSSLMWSSCHSSFFSLYRNLTTSILNMGPRPKCSQLEMLRLYSDFGGPYLGQAIPIAEAAYSAAAGFSCSLGNMKPFCKGEGTGGERRRRGNKVLCSKNDTNFRWTLWILLWLHYFETLMHQRCVILGRPCKRIATLKHFLGLQTIFCHFNQFWHSSSLFCGLIQKFDQNFYETDIFSTWFLSSIIKRRPQLDFNL